MNRISLRSLLVLPTALLFFMPTGADAQETCEDTLGYVDARGDGGVWFHGVQPFNWVAGQVYEVPAPLDVVGVEYPSWLQDRACGVAVSSPACTAESGARDVAINLHRVRSGPFGAVRGDLIASTTGRMSCWCRTDGSTHPPSLAYNFDEPVRVTERFMVTISVAAGDRLFVNGIPDSGSPGSTNSYIGWHSQWQSSDVDWLIRPVVRYSLGGATVTPTCYELGTSLVFEGSSPIAQHPMYNPIASAGRSPHQWTIGDFMPTDARFEGPLDTIGPYDISHVVTSGWRGPCTATTELTIGGEIVAWYPDCDNDGFFAATSAADSCMEPTGGDPCGTGEAPPGGWSREAGSDCNDGDAAVNPDAVESCDGIDNDCDEATADGADDDGFGDACDGDDDDMCTSGMRVCHAESRMLVCDDDAASIEEVCGNGDDDDCDEMVDEGCPGPDAGPADAGSAPAPTTDGGMAAMADAGATEPPDDGGGCGCRVGTESTSPAWLLMLPALVLLGRRRKR